MDTTTHTTRRLALLPVTEPGRAARPGVRRYRLGRVIGDLGAHMAGPAATRAAQAPVSGDRAP